MAAPFFSVVIPTLNEEKFLPKLLSSLCEQTYTDFEVIVVDGASVDKTVVLARTFTSKLPALQVIESKIAGLPLQRNLGVKAARGSYFVLIDADSILMPYALSRMAWFIKTNAPELFTSWFSPDSSVSGDTLFTLIGNMFIEGAIATKRPVAPGPLTVVSRSAFEQVDGYDESLAFGEDFDFTMRICATGVTLQMLRETLYIISLRRVRRDGKLKFVQLYARASLFVLLTKRTLRRVPEYIMGGHVYTKKPASKKRASLLRSLESKLKTLSREIFE